MAFHHLIDISWIDQIRCMPAVKVIFGHEAINELSDLVGVAACDRDRQVLKPNHLVVTRIVALVETRAVRRTR